MRDKWFPLTMLIVAIGTYIGRNGSLFAYSGGPIDSALGVLFLIFLAWLLWPKQEDESQ